MAEHEAYFASADSYISCRHVSVLSDVSLKLCHEALAESHDFVVRFAFRIEIGTTFCTTHRQCGQTVLESLFESEELHDAEVHARMETDSSLVWSDGTVHLYPVSSVDLHFSFIVYPRNSEHDYSFRFCNALQNLHVHQIRMFHNVRGQAFHHFPYCLMKFFFTRISGYQSCHEIIYILLSKMIHCFKIYK